jgi:iron complex outermembrane receptor protein
MLLAGAAMLPGHAFAQATEAQASDSGSGLSEIVVTAQRREERSQDVPIAITAMSAEGLRERGVTNLQGLQSQVPSLVVAPNGQTSRDVMSPSIRGQSASFQGAPAVVVYMNEVPLPTAISLSGQGGPGTFTDLQNVQVLSGAQGTLFGRNTTGGAVLLTPAKPTDRLEGHIQGGFGNYNMTELEAVVNVPLSDTLRVRLVGATRDRDGFTHDINWNKDRDDQHTRMARIGIQWEPTEGVSSYTMGYYGYGKSNGTGTVPININTAYLAGLAARPVYGPGNVYYGKLGAIRPAYNFCGAGTGPANCSSITQLITDQQARGNRIVAHGLDDFTKVYSWGVSNSTDVDLTDNLKLRNIISYASLKSYYAGDGDGTILNLYDQGQTDLSRTAPRDFFRLFTEELQFQGSALDKKLTYTFGGFYSKQTPGGAMKSYSVNVCALPGTAGALACSGFSETRNTNESKALFAQATLDLGALTPALDRVRLTGGYRYTWDRIDGSAINYGPADGSSPVTCSFDGVSVPLANVGNLSTDSTRGCRYDGHLRSSAPNWTVGIDYRPISNVLLYGKVTKGYKAGGFNGFAVHIAAPTDYSTFGPEYVTDWEAGFKSDFKVAGRPVRLNVNGFNMDYKNIQRGLPDYNADTGKSGAVTLNNAVAVIRGVEIEAMVKPVDILEIGGNYSHIDSHYKSFTYTSAVPVGDCGSNFSNGYRTTTSPDLSCLPLQYLAPNIFSVYGRLSIPTADSFGKVSLFVSYAWTDKQETAPGSLQEYPRPNASDPVKIWEPGVRLPSYGLLSASLDWKNLLGTNLDASIFGTNLTNKQYVISNSGVFNSVGAQGNIFGEPRMYGMRLKYNFGN